MFLNANPVLLVGDTHQDAKWLNEVVLPMAGTNEVEAVVVLGDFGYWDNDSEFLRSARDSKTTHGVDVWFIDGNHENHALLRADASKAAGGEVAPRVPLNLGGSLYYLPRASVVRVGELLVGCLGGAVSIDRFERVEGVSWFSEETITDADIAAAKSLGAVDVMLTHDAPSRWHISTGTRDDELPMKRRIQLAAIASHRRDLRSAYEAMTPSMLVHGHYHVFYDEFVGESWGDVNVVGLAPSGAKDNARVLRSVAGAAHLVVPPY